VSAPIALSKPQANMLTHVRWVGASGYDAPRKHPVLVALDRRGMAEFRGTRAAPRIEAWHATAAGQKWVDDRAAAAKAMPDG
jgi:hypothetical protein